MKPAAPKKVPSTKLPDRKEEPVPIEIPKDAKLIGWDSGVVNIGGFVAGDEIHKPYTITTGQYYHATGQKTREKQRANAEALARVTVDEDGVKHESEFAIHEGAVQGARTQTTDAGTLLQALQVRRDAFPVLYEFYGQEALARHKFLNFQGKQRVLEQLVKRVLPTKDHILVAGDANFDSGKKGHPRGVAGLFLNKCLEKGRTVVFADEFRSSCVDSKTHQLMYHPPKCMGINRYGRPFLKRIYGFYLASAPGSSTLWNRDENAAINILKNFLATRRDGAPPAAFRRETQLEPTHACGYRYVARAEDGGCGGGFRRWHRAADQHGR